MVGVGSKVGSVNRFLAVGWIGNDHTHRCEQPSRERAHNVVGGLIDKRGQLGLISAVDQEEPETVIGIHNLHLAEIVVSLQRYSMEEDIGINLVSLARTWEGGRTVGLKTILGLGGGNGDLKELQSLILPYLCICIR